jgi:DNA polymerase III sliding clamp (beta) subunit (PCNA family)
MTCKRDALIDVLKKVLPGVETGRTVLDGVDTFTVKEGFIHSYNDIISISSKLPDELKALTGCIKAEEFYKIISKLPSEEIDISTEKENIWILKSGQCVVEVSIMQEGSEKYAVEIVKERSDKEWNGLPEDFIEGVKRSKISRKYQSAYAGLFFMKDSIYSVDTKIANRFKFKKEGIGNAKFMISDASANELVKFEIKRFTVGGAWIHFCTDSSVYFSCRKLQSADEFPVDKIKDLFKKYTDCSFEIEGKLPKELSAACDRASIFAYDDAEKNIIKLTLSSEQIDIYAERNTGKYVEKIKWEKKFEKEFEPITIFINYDLIRHGMGMSFCVKKIQKKDSEEKTTRFIFSDEVFMSIISPFEKGNN